MRYNSPMTNFYTRTGDDGNTGLLGEGRVPKNHPIPQTVGTIDEASAALGLARAICRAEGIAPIILEVQRDLYHIMAEISATPNNAERFRVIDDRRVLWLEQQIETLGEFVNMPAEFIVPGDSYGGAALALARTIVRRAERRLLDLSQENHIQNTELLRYINRLSTLCFVLELYESSESGGTVHTLARHS